MKSINKMRYLKTYKIFEKLSNWGSITLSENEFNDLLDKNCKNHKFSKTSIYRGTIDLGDYVFVDPLKGWHRSSIEDTNIHIDLIDTLPAWNNYPKYSKSVIGLTSHEKMAGTYGDALYEVIPYDNSQIVVCPEPTIWESFSDTDGWGDYIYLIDYLLSDLGVNNVNDLKELGNIKSHSGYEPDELFLNHLKSYVRIEPEKVTGLDCYNFINDYLFNPDERGFKLLKYTKEFSVYEHKQVWTSGPVLMKKIN